MLCGWKCRCWRASEANVKKALRPTRVAGHASTRTTQLYNKLPEETSLDEIERITHLSSKLYPRFCYSDQKKSVFIFVTGRYQIPGTHTAADTSSCLEKPS